MKLRGSVIIPIAVILIALALVLYASTVSNPWAEENRMKKRTMSTICTEGPCKAGEYYGNSGHCYACPNNTYMALNDHRCSSCIQCTGPSTNSLTFEVEKCRPDANAILGCVPGSFRVSGPDEPDLTCLKCSDCQYYGRVMKKPCSDDKDTICDEPTSPDRSPRQNATVSTEYISTWTKPTERNIHTPGDKSGQTLDYLGSFLGITIVVGLLISLKIYCSKGRGGNCRRTAMEA